MKFIVIFLMTASLGACQSRYVAVSRCQPVPPKTLVTVQDYILRTVELETYLNECTQK